MYRHQLNLVVRHLEEFYPEPHSLYELEYNADIAAILREMGRENEAAGVWRSIQHHFRKTASRDTANSAKKVSSGVQSKSRLSRTFKRL